MTRLDPTRSLRGLPTALVRAILVLALFAASVSAAAVTAPPASAAPVTPFDDVPSDAFYTDAVAWLADAAITTGTSPTTFSPERPVTRGQMAAFLERYAQDQGVPGEHGFGDVPAGVYYDGSVSFLAERAITTGTSPTTYSPNDVVTRAQMATFLWRFSLEPTTDAPMPFTDVPAGTYYYEAVRWLADKGITTGTSPTMYSPNDVVTRGQMATFLWRLAGKPIVGELGANRVDLETTIVAEETDLGAATTIVVGGVSQLEWMTSDVPDVGDVVVMGVTDETPTGFIGEVTSAVGSMIATRPATLQDAIPQADFASTFDFDDPALAPSGLQTSSIKDAFNNVSAKCQSGGKSFSVDLDLAIDSGLEISASWDPFSGKGVEAYVGFSATATATVDVTVSGEVSCSATVSVDGPKLRPITFWLGPVPVVLVPEISFEAEIGGSFKASATAGFTYSQTLGVGLRFEDGRWSTEYTNTRDSFFRAPSFAAQATATIELRARLDVKAYGIGGPYVTIGPFFELSVQNNIPWWNIDAGLRASVGAAIDVFFFQEDIQFAEIDLVRFRLADSGDDEFPLGFSYLEGIPLTAISAGGATTCGIDGYGSVHCWGDNFWGQVGDGTGVNRTKATRVPGISDAVEVSTAGTHTCARRSDGTISCWGDNQFGQLGDGTTDPSASPVPVAGITTATRVVTGSSQTCAVLADLTAMCWGRNDNGQVGNPSVVDAEVLVPVPVLGVDAVTDIAVGNGFACALRATGTVKCWGYNFDGQLGNGQSGIDAFSNVAVPVSGLDDAVQIGAGELYTCARKTDGTVVCWGAGSLGNPTTTRSSLPLAVTGLSGVTDIGVGGSSSCAVVEVGPAQCWGSDFSGGLGNGAPNVMSATPVAVTSGEDFDQISVGNGHACAVYKTDVGLCWGNNDFGQIGDGTTISRSAPLNRVQNPF